MTEEAEAASVPEKSGEPGAGLSKGQSLSQWGVATFALTFLNVLLFFLMCLYSSWDNLLQAHTKTILDWGANYGPRTLTGEPWRLISSGFLHFGILHLVVNMTVLLLVGRQVERIFGSARFLIIYLLSTLGSGCLSLLIVPTGAGAGASGAIFGLFGALLSFVVGRPWAQVSAVMHWTGYLGMLLASLSLIFGIAAGGGTANHLGGLLSGFLSGYFCLRNMQANRRNKFERYAGLGFGAVFLLVFFVAVTYTPLDALGNYKLAMAMRRIDDGDAPAALPLIEEYLRRHPRDPQGLYYLAVVLQSLNEDARAIVTVDQAIKYGAGQKGNSNLIGIYSLRADSEFDLGRYDDCLKDAAQALEIGADLDLFETRTRAFCQKGDYKSAYNELNKYSESKGRKVQCLLLRSEVERHQDKVSEALTDIEQALKLEPQSKQGRAEVVSLKAENGDVVGAVLGLNDIFRDSKKPGTYLFPALMSFTFGQYRLALADARPVMEQKIGFANGKAIYGALTMLLAYRALHDQGSEEKLVAEVNKKIKSNIWPVPIYKYLTGTIELKDLLSQVSDVGRDTETRTFLTMNRLVTVGTADNAVREGLEKQLLWVKENGNMAYLEYDVARILLVRLRQGVYSGRTGSAGAAAVVSRAAIDDTLREIAAQNIAKPAVKSLGK